MYEIGEIPQSSCRRGAGHANDSQDLKRRGNMEFHLSDGTAERRASAFSWPAVIWAAALKRDDAAINQQSTSRYAHRYALHASNNLHYKCDKASMAIFMPSLFKIVFINRSLLYLLILSLNA